MTDDFTIRTTGPQTEYETGYRRDGREGKVMFTTLDWGMIERAAAHMTKGAARYGKHNWRNAETERELEDATDSLWRHVLGFVRNDRSEDHWGGIYHNCTVIEHVRAKRNLND